MYSVTPFVGGRRLIEKARRCPVPCQVAFSPTRSTRSEPAASTPIDDRRMYGVAFSSPPWTRTPAGTPSALLKSPLMPTVVAVFVASRRWIAVTVSLPMMVPFESTGASV